MRGQAFVVAFAGALASSAGSFAAPAPAAPPQKLAPERVREAIAWGQKATEKDVEQYVLKVAPTWTLNFDTPFLRVAQLARAWKKRKRDLKETDVPAGVIEPEVHVYALALQQPGTKEPLKNVTHVVIRKPGAAETVSPSFTKANLNRARSRTDFSPAGIAQSLEAVFSLRDFTAGNEIRVIFQDGSHESVTLTRAGLATAR
jgi:hypothetical protein